MLWVVIEPGSFWESESVGKSSSMSITSSRSNSSLEEQRTNPTWTWHTHNVGSIFFFTVARIFQLADPLEIYFSFTYMLSSTLSWPSSVGGSHACNLTFHSLICWSHERRLYFLNLLGVFGWTPGWRMCLEKKGKTGWEFYSCTVNVCILQLSAISLSSSLMMLHLGT